MATALGIGKSQVQRDNADGMPMGSVEAARRWRDANRDPMRVPLAERGPLQLVHALAAEIDGMDGDPPAVLLQQLRAGLRSVPGPEREAVRVSVKVWALLMPPSLRGALPVVLHGLADDEVLAP